MSSGSSTPQNVVTTQNKDPWVGAQQHLAGIMNQAQYLNNASMGYQPYTGQTVATPDNNLLYGLGYSEQIAAPNAYGTAGVRAGQNLATNVIGSQGITPGIQGALGGLGQVGNIYGNIAGLNGGLTQDQWNKLSGLDATSSLYGQMYGEANGQQNPYLQSVLDAQGRKIADQVNSTMSGAGRYGSGAHTNVLSRNLAEAADPILAQDYQNRQQQKLASLQGLQNTYGQQLGAYQQGITNQFGGASGMGQAQGQIADLYGQGLNRAGQYSQLVPSLDAAQYDPAQRLMQTGQYRTDLAQQNINADVNRYNALQAYPWEQLSRYAALVNGAGGLGGTTVTTQPNLSAPVGGLQGALGGALAGAGVGTSIFGPGVGSLAGAGVGGLLGYLR